MFVRTFISTLIILYAITTSLYAQEPFKIFLIQDGIKKNILFDDSATILKRKPFKIEVWLINIDGVFASVSFDKLYYQTPLRERFHDWKYVGYKVMAEDIYNYDKSIVSSADGLGYWYFDPISEDTLHRFDKTPIQKGDTIIATMSVDSISSQETRETVPLKDLTKTVYLVFFSTVYNAEEALHIETHRVKTRLILK